MKLLDWLFRRKRKEAKPLEEDPWKETPEQIAARERTTYWFLMQVALSLEKQRKAKQQEDPDNANTA